jgi:hypothetical protein
VRLDESSLANAGALALIGSVLGDAPAIAPAGSAADPYYGQGSHPDVVERVWDELGRAVPAECRCLVRGTPALVQPTAGIVLAFSLGTRYYVRTPSGIAPYGAAELEPELGLERDWALGRWGAAELGWCRAVYDELESPAPPAA